MSGRAPWYAPTIGECFVAETLRMRTLVASKPEFTLLVRK